MLNADFSKINRGETIAVALSGGMDSVCLLYCLLEKKKELGINLVAVNVEHGIRGEFSARDSEFCRKLCSELGVKFYFFTVDSPFFAEKEGLSIEESARILRYECFLKLISDGLCDKVAVAHHLSDNAETILFNILRGASLSGASGIRNISYNDGIIRPFLNVTREEIRQYVDYHAISYVDDETNADDFYTRNYLRLRVIPAIKKVFPKAEAALSRFADACRSDDEFLYSIAEKHLKKENNCIMVPCNIAYPVFSRAIITALKLFGINKDYTKANIDDVWSLTTKCTGKTIHLQKGVYAVREYDNIVLRKTENFDFTAIPYKFGAVIVSGVTICTEKVKREDINFKDGLYFDSDKLPADAVIRRKLDGDMFTKPNGQTVSLKKYLTDKKIPAYKKRSLFLIASGKTAYIILGVEISRSVMIDGNTKNIAKITCTKDTDNKNV